MGWTPNHPTDSILTPVDNLVDDLSDILTGAHRTCDAIKGKDAKCCNRIFGCFVTFENLLTSVKIQAIVDQNIHRACSDLEDGLTDFLACTGTEYTSNECSRADSSAEIKRSVDGLLVELYRAKNDHCSNLPATTKKPSTTSTTTTSTTTTTTTPPQTPPSTTSSSTSSTTITMVTTDIYNQTEVFPTSPENSTSPFLTSTSPADAQNVATSKVSSDVITIAAASVGALLLLMLLCGVLLLVMIRKRKASRRTGGKGQTVSKKRFFDGFFKFSGQSATGTGTNTEEEIYAEIDDTFMDAVYRSPDQEEPRMDKKRVGSKTQINACYGRHAMPDVIMNVTHSDAVHAVHVPTNRKQRSGEMITSFQTDQSKHNPHQKPSSNITNAKFVLPNPRYVISRPGFSDLRHDGLSQDEYLTAQPAGDVIPMMSSMSSNYYDTTGLSGQNENKPYNDHTYDSVHHGGTNEDKYLNDGYCDQGHYEESGWNGGMDLSMVY